MNKIIYNFELHLNNQNYWYNYNQYIKQIKNKIDYIKLSLYCAKYCFEYNNEEIKGLAKKCIDLVNSGLINPELLKLQELSRLANDSYSSININIASGINSNVVWALAYSTFYHINNFNIISSNASHCLYYSSQIQNIDMNLIHQYLQTLLRTNKQFNIENPYSKTIEQISKQDVDKLELVDYNMLLDISNEHYNIDLSEFNYENIFSRRNLIELIRREYD